MRDFQIFVRVIGKGSNPLGARTQSPNLPRTNWIGCNVLIIRCLNLYNSTLLTKIGSIPTLFAGEPCRILVFNRIHQAVGYGGSVLRLAGTDGKSRLFPFLLGVPTFLSFGMSVHINTGFFTESFTFQGPGFTELDIHEIIDVC